MRIDVQGCGEAGRWLWLTFADPEPRHNGQFIYSGGLVEALAQTGARISVLGLARRESPPRQNAAAATTVSWWLPGEDLPRSRWRSLASPLPNIAYRCSTRGMRTTLEGLLQREAWDVIVFDSLAAGWALPSVRARYRGDCARRPRVLYVSHNHEESVRAQVARNQTFLPRRLAGRWDAFKVSRLERDLLREADLVTAITSQDKMLYRVRHATKPIEVITPGYGGRRVSGRCISSATPRRAIIVGSFDWIAKRMNLIDFVSVADPKFAAAGAQLQAVGSADDAFLSRLRSRFAATQFTGSVPDVTRYLDEARIAIVPEANGGGFKLKVLDYVFNRVPVFALDNSFAGVPLVNERSVKLFPSVEALVAGVLAALDDYDLLNRLQQNAYDACAGAFDWTTRGRQLQAAVGHV